MNTSARAAIDHLPAYSFPDLDLPGVDRVVVLAQNEIALPPSPKALQAAGDALENMNRYSDIEQLSLRRAIAGVHSLNIDKLVCGAGSLELMSLIANAYCVEQCEVVVSQYGYKFFQVLCTAAGARIRVVDEPDMRVDIEAILAAVNKKTRIVFLVNPGNPTGLGLAPGEVLELRRRLPQSVMLILDCAYAEFAEDSRFEDGFDLVDQGQNLVVLRTFSKAYGLAGMRVGWAYGPDDVVETLLKIRPPNSISTPSLEAATAAILDRDYLALVCDEVAGLRGELIDLLHSFGFTTLPSVTNFVLFRCPHGKPIGAAELDNSLRQQAVIVRPMGSYDLNDHLRVSVGSREEMEVFGSALSRILAKA